MLVAPIFVAGCSHDDSTPQTLEQQKADVTGPGQIPPDVLAKARSMYGPNGSYQQKVNQNTASAGAAKQAADAKANSQPQAPANP